MGRIIYKEKGLIYDKNYKSKEDLEANQYERFTRDYITSHKEEINRKVDVLIAYIASFRKICIVNFNSINGELLSHVTTTSSAVRERESYLKEYLYSIKQGFKIAANNTLIIKQDYISLMEINLEGYDRNYDKEYKEVCDVFTKTAQDVSPIGRAFGEYYIASSYGNKVDYNAKKGEFLDLGNTKDRYFVDINFREDTGYAELSIISFHKLGQGS
jgi:hypothetical protein